MEIMVHIFKQSLCGSLSFPHEKRKKIVTVENLGDPGEGQTPAGCEWWIVSFEKLQKGVSFFLNGHNRPWAR